MTKHVRLHRLAIVSSHPIQYFAPLYRRLAAEEDIDLTVFYCSRAGLDEYEDEGFGGEKVWWDVPLLEGYESVFLPNLRGDRVPGGFWSLVNPAVVSALRRGGYDAVWIHGHAYATYQLAVLGAIWAGSALLMRCDTHLGLDRSALRRTLRRWLMPAYYRLFDAYLAIGSRNAEFYRQHGVNNARIFRVPYVVDNHRFEQGARLVGEAHSRRRRELGLPDDGVPVILFLSKLTSRKRPLDLLRAFHRLRADGGMRAALALVGAGPEEEGLRRFVERARVPDVRFLGFRNQAELPTIYGACDVFVLPSENEPWGLVVNEAMSAGLPVVVSEEVGAAADLVDDGVNGFRFEVGDITALTGCLEQLVEREELRRRMGRASREMIREWDLDACVAGVRRALNAVTARRPTERPTGRGFEPQGPTDG